MVKTFLFSDLLWKAEKTYYFLHLLRIGYFRLAGFQDGLKDKITNHKQMNRITNKISSLRYNEWFYFYVSCFCIQLNSIFETAAFNWHLCS